VTVQPGDTLWRIAAEKLHNPALYPLIKADNPGVGPNGLIIPGQVLRIPQLPAPPPGSTVQIVQPGQDLWEIAGGNEARVQQIAELNHLADPALIFPGQPIIIPPGALSGAGR
jgi:nucleoid-associated protein YgaU